MNDDLKLLGEVGLGYSKLSEDAENINKIINNIDTNLKKLGKELEGKNINMNIDFGKEAPEKTAKEIAKAFREINQEGSKAHGATGDLAKDFSKIGKTIEETTKKTEELNASLKNIAKANGAKNVANKLIPTDFKKAEKELKAYYERINKVSTLPATNQNIGKLITKELQAATMESDRYAEAMRMANMFVGYNNTSLKNTNAELTDINHKLTKAKSELQIKDSFLSEKTLNKGFTTYALEKRAKSASGKIKMFARSAAIDYVDEFGRTIRETWRKKEGKFFPSTAKIITNPLKSTQSELQKTYNQMAASGVSVSKKVSMERKKIKRAEIKEIEQMEKQLAKAQMQADKASTAKRKSPINSTFVSLAELYAIRRALTSVNNEILEFQKNQIEVERIARNTTTNAKDLVDATFEISKNTGTMVSQTQEVAALWARTGKSGEQLKAAMETTTMGFNVAEFKDAETAVASMNAIINQMYKGDATKAPEILDSLVKVADKTAVRNVEDLAEVASRAGANAASLNMDLHELNAVSSIIMENMKVNGDVLGNQLKTVFSRMLNEGNIKKLRELGVEMTVANENGTRSMKDFESAFDDVVKKYQHLMSIGDEVSANKLTEIIGGTRFKPVVANLIKDWDKFGERVTMSMDSAGFAAEQNEKMMESYAKKVEQLKVAYTELAVSLGEGGVLDILTKMAEGSKSVIELIGKMPSELKGVIAILGSLAVLPAALYKLQSIMLSENSLLYLMIHGVSGLEEGKMLVPGLSKITEKLKEVSSGSIAAGEAVGGIATTATHTGGAVEGLAIAFSNALIAAKGLIAGLTAMQMTLGGIALAVGVAGAVAYKGIKEKQERLEKFSSGGYNKEIDDIRKLKEEYDKLSLNPDVVNEGTEAFDRLSQVHEQLSKALGDTSTALHANAASIEANQSILQARISLKEKEIELEKKKADAEARNEIDRATNFFNPNALSSQIEALKTHKRLMKEATAAAEKMADKPVKIPILSDGAMNKAKMSIDAYNSSLVSVQEEYLRLVDLAVAAGGSEDTIVKALEKHVSSADLAAIMSGKLADESGNLSEQSEETSEQIDEAADSVDGLAESADDAKNALSTMAEEVSNVHDKVGVMKSAMEEYNENGVISYENVVKAISSFPQLADCLVEVEGGYALTTDALTLMNRTQDEAIDKTRELVDSYRNLNSTQVDDFSVNFDIAMNEDNIRNIQTAMSNLNSEVSQSIQSISQSFDNGKYSAEEYFFKISEAIRSVDFSTLSASQIQMFSSAIQTYLANAVASLDRAFSAGSISRDEYKRQLQAIQTEAIRTYSQLNNLSYVDGNWVNKAGEVDKFANSIASLGKYSGDGVDSLEDVADAVKNLGVTINEAGDLILDFGSFSEVIDDFASNFIGNMEYIRDTNNEVWEQIVEQVATDLGITEEAAANALLGVNSSSQATNAALSSALSIMLKNLYNSMSASGKGVAGIIDSIIEKLKGTNFEMLATLDMGHMVPLTLIDVLGKQFGANLKAGWGFRINGGNGAAGAYNATGNGYVASNKFDSSMGGFSYSKSTGKMDTYSPFDIMSNSAAMRTLRAGGNPHVTNMDHAFNQNYVNSNPIVGKYIQAATRSKGSMLKSVEDVVFPLLTTAENILSSQNPNLLPRRGKGGSGGGGSGRGGRGGSGGRDKKDKKKKKKEDIPENVQKQIDSLRHKLDLDELEEYQFAKELEKVLMNNKKVLTEKGIREIEKMIYNSRKGGVKEGFKAQIDELEDLIALADVTIESLETERKLLDMFDAEPYMKINVENQMSDMLSSKVTANMALVRKYRIAVEEINKELGKLDSTSIGYSKTVEQLKELKGEYTQKIRKTTVAIDQLKQSIAELALHQFELKKEKIEKSIAVIERIEQHTIDMINGRNEKIREGVQERHRAEMEALQKANEARDKSHRKEMQRIQKEADAFRKYMEDKIKALNREAAKDDYEYNVQKKLDEINKLEKKINELSRDDSYKAKGQVIKYREELSNKKEELERFQQDRERTIIQEGLQDQLSDYESQLKEKQDLLNEEMEMLQEKSNNEMELLRKRQEAEMKSLEETMNAKNVAMEAERAMHTGLVEDLNGNSRNLKDAIISYMKETGQWSGILRDKFIQDFEAVFNQVNSGLQMLGLGGKEGLSSLQAMTGLTDESYTHWKREVAEKTGVAVEDVEEYVSNKARWKDASPEERKRLNQRNHEIRQKIVDTYGDQSHNFDKNGLVFGVNDLLPNKNDKRYDFIQNKPRFSPFQGMPMDQAEDLYKNLVAREVDPKNARYYNGQIDNIRRYSPAANSYTLGDILGNEYANSLSTIGRSESILDIDPSEIEVAEVREELERRQREMREVEKSNSPGGSWGGSGGSIDYDRMVEKVMGNASPQQKNFIKKILPKSMEMAKKYNISLSALLGQAVHESYWGQSSLAQDKALFGIKHSSGYKRHGMYRAYDSWDESIEDYAKMISGNSSSGLYKIKGVVGAASPEEHLRKIQDKSLGGFAYAEDSNYVNKTLSIIDSNNFREFERLSPSDFQTGSGYVGGGSQYRTPEQEANVERLMQAAHKQDGMPYSMNTSLRVGSHRDCSSYVGHATTEVGLNNNKGMSTYKQGSNMAKFGWVDLGTNYPVEKLRKGDVLWIRANGHHHTEFINEDGTLNTTGAHNYGVPAGPSKWYKPWKLTHVLRHPSLNGYSQGGIADYTGVAMLHGSKVAPEYIFNAPQFEALGKIIAAYVSTPRVELPTVKSISNMESPFSIVIDNLVQINGDATPETAQQVREASENVLDNLAKALKKRGK